MLLPTHQAQEIQGFRDGLKFLAFILFSGQIVIKLKLQLDEGQFIKNTGHKSWHCRKVTTNVAYKISYFPIGL